MFSLNLWVASVLLQKASSARRAFASRQVQSVSEHACISLMAHWCSRCCAPLQPWPAASSAQGQLHCSVQRSSGSSRRDDGRGLRLRRVAARRLRRYHGRCGRNRQFRGSTHSITRPLETRWSERRLAGGARSTREISAGGARARLYAARWRRDPCALLCLVAGRRVAPATGVDSSA